MQVVENKSLRRNPSDKSQISAAYKFKAMLEEFWNLEFDIWYFKAR